MPEWIHLIVVLGLALAFAWLALDNRHERLRQKREFEEWKAKLKDAQQRLENL